MRGQEEHTSFQEHPTFRAVLDNGEIKIATIRLKANVFTPCDLPSGEFARWSSPLVTNTHRLSSTMMALFFNAPEVFNGVEEALDKSAFSIKRKIAIAVNLVI